MKNITAAIFFFATSTIFSYGQLTQNIRGVVYDEGAKFPIPGVVVKITNLDTIFAATTNMDGEFLLKSVPIGRVNLVFSLNGYAKKTIQNLDVISGKEIVLEIGLVEQIFQKEEVVIRGKEKGKPNNEMATLSAQQFSIEATQRYAGSVNDVARMAQNFAGVQGNDDSRNDIIVRGNSPIGVLYRYEGVDIPNPNHFALLGTAGGPVSILNNNVLANSDFFTGAFPAEYGNALAAVFDLKMRNGNNQRHEFLGQIGFNGAEFMAEGPLSQSTKSSYLFSYRYATLRLFALAGINFGTGVAVPDYQDINFKINFHQKKGSTSLFGIGGLSNVSFEGGQETEGNNLFTDDFEDIAFQSAIGMVGLKNIYRVNDKIYLKTTISTSATNNQIERDSLIPPSMDKWASYRNKSLEGRNNINAQINYKRNARNLFRGGVIMDRLFFELADSLRLPMTGDWFRLTDFQGSVFLLQPYLQWQHRWTEDITVNAGFHSQFFTLNNSYDLAPRLGIKYNLNDKNTLAAAYGKHAQLPPTRVYFRQVASPGGGTFNPNQNLGMTKAHHFVLSHTYRFTPLLSLKSETYYQYLYNVPVDVQSNTYSLLNFGANFELGFPDALVNEGTGRNYGVEFTLEQIMQDGMYLMSTVSLYRSLFTGSNGQLHGAAFNGNYTLNLLGGKEFNLTFKRKEKQRRASLLIDGRATLNGGQRHTPIDEMASMQSQQIIFMEEKTNTLQYPAYFRIDLRIAYKISYPKFTQEWAIDLRNLTNHQNIFTKEFNLNTGEYQTTYQLGFLPIGQWRIYF
ncbi:MAG: TonB-dependent receptor [Crocinitomicaceae bacterium]|nr:TonB-dependent receptor [Crocinitomicaceae bacterium]